LSPHSQHKGTTSLFSSCLIDLRHLGDNSGKRIYQIDEALKNVSPDKLDGYVRLASAFKAGLLDPSNHDRDVAYAVLSTLRDYAHTNQTAPRLNTQEWILANITQAGQLLHIPQKPGPEDFTTLLKMRNPYEPEKIGIFPGKAEISPAIESTAELPVFDVPIKQTLYERLSSGALFPIWKQGTQSLFH
jgi:hypothetical protein